MRDWLLGNNLSEMKGRALTEGRTLKSMKEDSILHASWKLVRWIVASNTAYLKLLEEDDELLQGIPDTYRQCTSFTFLSLRSPRVSKSSLIDGCCAVRLVVGSPAKEHLLKKAVEATSTDENSQKYPTLFAFHGSSVSNWHSILREGLHFKKTVNGRAYGHGVYCTPFRRSRRGGEMLTIWD